VIFGAIAATTLVDGQPFNPPSDVRPSCLPDLARNGASFCCDSHFLTVVVPLVNPIEEHGERSVKRFCVGSSHAPSPYCGQFTWPDMVALRSGETVRDEDEARCPVFAGVDRRSDGPGLARARNQGRRLGRPMLSAEKQRRVRDLLVAGTGIVKTARIVGCGVSAVQRLNATTAVAAPNR
jgi:hypothetical protein